MPQQKTELPESMNCRVFFILFMLILICYSNTFNASFHLDDFQNITKKTQLHLKNLYPETIYHAIFESQAGNKKVFYRPVSCLSIALNWYAGKDDVTGYHIVNISVHILTSFFLYLTFLSLFNTPNLKGKYDGNEHFIAVLAAVLWAVNPIQTQAVTYIVQRMASMAAMFYIFGIYCYVKARTSRLQKKKLLFFSAVCISFLMAVGSKENALMLPVSLFFLEMIFFRDLTDRKTRKKFYWLGCGIIFIIVILGMVLFVNGNFISRLMEGYSKRTFTLSERLMTEPRIVVFYLSQIFYPIVDRLSIDHDIVVSTSLFRPWTTLPSIFIIAALIGTALKQINKSPLFSFAVLFFFINHVIESSVIALELVFEHRNYLPSLFLFFPVAAAFKRMVDYYDNKKMMTSLLICFTVILVMMLGLGTYIRNMAWADEKTLWQDTIQKAPGRARAYQNLGSTYYSGSGKNYDKAFALNKKALDLDDSTLGKAEVISLCNMANFYARQKKDYEKVIQIYKKILTIDSDNLQSRYHLVLTLLKTGQRKEALKNIRQIVEKKPDQIKYLNTMGFVLLKMNKPDRAMIYLKKALKINPDHQKVLLSMGAAKGMIGQYNSAQHYLKRIHGRSSNKITAILLLIENSINAGNIKQAEKYASKLISGSSPSKIEKALEKIINDSDLQWPISTDLIIPVIVKEMEKRSEHISNFRKSGSG